MGSFLQRAFFLSSVAWLTACGMNLHSTTLKIGVIGRPYEDNFYVEEMGWIWDDGTALLVTGGSLPSGIDLTGDGRLIGTPTEAGEYSFEVTSYTFDTDFWSDDDDVYEDWEWYVLFVTEASTNPDCPSPDDEDVSETYICLGNISAADVAAGDAITLDVNYFVKFATQDDLAAMDFSIFYDPASLTPVATGLNSQALREAATRVPSEVAFTEPASGEMRVTLAAESGAYHKAGRLMDIPFTAAGDLAVGEYPFTVVIHGITTRDGQTPTTLVEMDGGLTVTESDLADGGADAGE